MMGGGDSKLMIEKFMTCYQSSPFRTEDTMGSMIRAHKHPIECKVALDTQANAKFPTGMMNRAHGFIMILDLSKDYKQLSEDIDHGLDKIDPECLPNIEKRYAIGVLFDRSKQRKAPIKSELEVILKINNQIKYIADLPELTDVPV